jgi:hypothetical protein
LVERGQVGFFYGRCVAVFQQCRSLAANWSAAAGSEVGTLLAGCTGSGACYVPWLPVSCGLSGDPEDVSSILLFLPYQARFYILLL